MRFWFRINEDVFQPFLRFWGGLWLCVAGGGVFTDVSTLLEILDHHSPCASLCAVCRVSTLLEILVYAVGTVLDEWFIVGFQPFLRFWAQPDTSHIPISK